MKSYFIIILSLLFLNIFTSVVNAGAVCSGCTACASGGSTGNQCSTVTTTTSSALTITKLPFTHTQTLDLGCYGEQIGLIDIKKIPSTIVYFGMTLNIVKIPFDIPASNPFNKGTCISCGSCASKPKSFDIYKLVKFKSSSCKTST